MSFISDLLFHCLRTIGKSVYIKIDVVFCNTLTIFILSKYHVNTLLRGFYGLFIFFEFKKNLTVKSTIFHDDVIIGSRNVIEVIKNASIG